MNEMHTESFEAIETSIGPVQGFQFERLSSTTCIRLIKIHPELVRGDISCTLQQHESDSSICPAYVALSYVWGDSTPRHIIYINGLVCRVHHSLWQFLDRNRTNKAIACEWFWTDLLCIDQMHHSEKNEQISRMGDIYAEAKYVISWLGERESTVEAIRTIIQISKEDDIGFPLKYAWKTTESHQIHKACDQLAFVEPYWGRVWIMQEVACAKDCIVVCGDIFLNFRDLLYNMETAMNRSTRFDYSSDRGRRTQRIRTLANIRNGILEGRSMSTFDLLRRTSFCQATRDQDRIYGLLGLARRLDHGFNCRALEISYDKSLSDIWWDMIFMILDEKSEISAKDDLMALKSIVPILPPPREHLELNGITSIRGTQAETACQVSEAVYSISVQRFLGILIYDMDGLEVYSRSNSIHREMLRKGWEEAMTHICHHEKDLPCLQTRIGRSALAGLRFTSWQTLEGCVSPSVEPSDCLPSGWLCAAHLPDHLQSITSKHRIIPSYNIEVRMDDSAYCSEASYHVGACDLSFFVLNLAQLGITCLIRRTPCCTEIEFFCDCCHPGAPSDNSSVLKSEHTDSDAEVFFESDVEGSDTTDELAPFVARLHEDPRERIEGRRQSI